jgi:carotenoid 1,2-hydratase
MSRRDVPPPRAMRIGNEGRPRCNTDDDADDIQSPVSGNGGRAVWPRITRLDGLVPATRFPQPNPRTLSGGWQHASRPGGPDGRNIGTSRGTRDHEGPRFDAEIPPGGYAWWYIDALSDDGQHGLTIIAFVGSVFSPYYAAHRRRGAASPYDYCAINVALYGRRGKHWAMTERRQTSLVQSARTLAIGPSSFIWDGTTLVIAVDEIAIPRLSPIRGLIRVHPRALAQYDVALDGAGRHLWRPIAPQAQVEVQLDKPALNWRGSSYFDSNEGSASLESEFRSWTWSRSDTEDGTIVLYDVTRRTGEPLSIALRFDRTGRHDVIPSNPVAPLPQTRWRVNRASRSEDGTASVIHTLEDTPFYARSLICTKLLGAQRIGMHESLSLDRFSNRWVQAMLPFRMPRAFL